MDVDAEIGEAENPPSGDGCHGLEELPDVEDVKADSP